MGVAVLFGVASYFLLNPLVGGLLVGLFEKDRLPQECRRRRCREDRHRAILLGVPGFIVGWIVARYVNRGLGWAFGLFNKAFDVFAHGYARIVGVALQAQPRSC